MIDQFYVGQRVVCINDRYRQSICEWCDALPRAGQIYTIKRIAACPDTFSDEWGIGLLFEELNNFTDQFCYSAERFAPLVLAEMEAEELLAVAN